MRTLSEYHWLYKQPIAHRGLHTNDKRVPENSLLAFQKAIDNGYAIELDVHVTIDQMVLVFHDDDLSRLCGKKDLIHEISQSTLSKYRLLGSDQMIPRLEEVLKLVNGQVPLLIEIKLPKGIKNTNQIILNHLTAYKGEFAIQAFNPFTVKWFADNAPDIIRGQLASDLKDVKLNPLKKWLLKGMKLNKLTHPDFLAFNVDDLPNPKVAKFRHRRNPVLGWTIRDEQQLEKAKTLCDNIIFENLHL